MHTAHLRDPSRSPPWGVLEIELSGRQLLLLKTKQKIKQFTRLNGLHIVEISQVCDHRTEDGRSIKLIKTTSKQFPRDCDPAVMELHIANCKVEDEFIEWNCEVNDLKYLNKELRGSTKIMLCPLSSETPVLHPWLEKTFKRKISRKELEAMAWLLGFWIGDGHRRGALFSVHSEDHDVNGRLKHSGGLWGMHLRIVHRGPAAGFKADAYLRTYDGVRYHWNAHNPLVKVLEGLKFYENGRRDDRKSVPLFMRSETQFVRETFMAGLIDADGSTNVQDRIIRIKIPTAFPPIRDGILSIGRSLALNVTVYFHHARENKNGYHEQDTWIFHILPGNNVDVLWSILHRCSCERKKNPKVQYARTRDIEEFESDDSDFSPNDELTSNDASESEREREETIQNDPSVGEEDPEEDDEVEYEVGDEAENETPEKLHCSTLSFKTSNIGKKEVYGIILSADRPQYLITDQQIICAGSQFATDESKSTKKFKEKCICCGVHITKDVWCKVPWMINASDRMCASCRKHYRGTLTRCSNSNCNRIVKSPELTRKRKRETKKACTLSDGTRIVGYKCDSCGSVTRTEETQKAAPTVTKEGSKKDNCYRCGMKESTSWRKVPWDTSRVWCGTCRSRYKGTATICTNKKCMKIPFKTELEKMKKISPSADSLICLDCGSPAKRDLSKSCRVVPALEVRKAKCYSCGPTSSNRWTSLPWDRNQAGEICAACYHRYRATGLRCLNDKCRMIFTKSEVNEMREQAAIEHVSEYGSATRCYPCVSCHGPTNDTITPHT